MCYTACIFEKGALSPPKKSQVLDRLPEWGLIHHESSQLQDKRGSEKAGEGVDVTSVLSTDLGPGCSLASPAHRSVRLGHGHLLAEGSQLSLGWRYKVLCG